MKCPNCGGTGKEYWNGNVFCNTGFECDKCHGTGEVEQTNEEWFCSLSTEEKAKEFVAIQLQECDSCEVITDKMIQSCFNRWKEWLKQPHHEKE